MANLCCIACLATGHQVSVDGGGNKGWGSLLTLDLAACIHKFGLSYIACQLYTNMFYTNMLIWQQQVLQGIRPSKQDLEIV